MAIDTLDLFGLKISVFNRDELVNEIISDINKKQKKVYYGYSFGFFPLYKKFPELYETAESFDLMVTDGRIFYLYARMFGAPLKLDISIPFLSRLLMQVANEKGYSMMLLGSSADTNSKATNRLRIDYPNAVIYDGYDGGFFTENDQKKSVQIINQNSPNILFIGVSSPKKELFAARWKEELDVNIIVPFGGMIDGLAGKVWLTPPLLKKLGLATPIRVLQEPRRMLLPNIWFFYETFIRIIPKTIFAVWILRNKNFFIPGIYGLTRKK